MNEKKKWHLKGDKITILRGSKVRCLDRRKTVPDPKTPKIKNSYFFVVFLEKKKLPSSLLFFLVVSVTKVVFFKANLRLPGCGHHYLFYCLSIFKVG